jgi:hypothetical protein
MGQFSYYQVRNNWQGKGYRLYFGDERFVSQVDGEINGRVFHTVTAAKTYCRIRFKCEAVLVFD